jgi:hypothetical protein
MQVIWVATQTIFIAVYIGTAGFGQDNIRQILALLSTNSTAEIFMFLGMN